LKNKRRNLTLFAVVILLLAASLVAFRPYGGDADADGVSDYTEALAEALGIDVDTLQAAQQTAEENALNQAVTDGLITQEQADAALSGEASGKPVRFKGSDIDMDTYLADALNITVEELESAEAEAKSILLDQALENGTITQEEYDAQQLRSTMSPYFENAYSSAYQSAIDAALADGAITEEQAAQLEAEPQFGGRGFDGGHGFDGGRGKHGGMTQDLEGSSSFGDNSVSGADN